MIITDSVKSVLSHFDRLSPREQIVVAREIGKRVQRDRSDDESGSLDAELILLTDQMFQTYDLEEQSTYRGSQPCHG